MDKNSLTSGNLWEKMLLFSIPLIIMNLLQALYNIVDMIVVGKFAGAAGLSAVSIGGQITALVLCIVLGLSDAGAVVIGQLIGGGKRDKVDDVLSTMFGVFAALSIVLSVLICIFTEPLLTLLNTPVESYDFACSYLRICMTGTIFIYLFNLLNGAFRGMGISTIPMFMVGCSSILNIVLDLILVGGLQLGSDGAAIATVTSQMVSLIVMLLAARRKEVIRNWSLGLFRIRKDALRTLLNIGIPESAEFLITNLSFLFLVGMINAYGVYASAAAGTVNKISSFAVLPAQAMFSAIITMTAQNIGAGKPKRALKGAAIGLAYVAPITCVFIVLSYVNPTWMLGLFTNEAEVITAGVLYLQIVSISFLIEAILFSIMGVVAGTGHTKVTLACTVVDAVLIRVPIARVCSVTLGLGFSGIGWAYVCAPAVSVVLLAIYLATGRWKTSTIVL